MPDDDDREAALRELRELQDAEKRRERERQREHEALVEELRRMSPLPDPGGREARKAERRALIEDGHADDPAAQAQRYIDRGRGRAQRKGK